MAQHDYNIENQSGADFRADLNNALLAIATVNSGATEPSTTFAHQLWVDTSSSVLKIRNAADNAWITTGVSITASNTFTGDLTGNVTGNVIGNVTGNVTGDLTGNADSADILSTARTISLSGDVVGSASFDGSANIDIDTVVQINSITLGTDTTGDYVESMSGGTGVTVTGGTGEGSTPSVAIGQAVATTDDVTFNIITASEEFIGDLEGGIRFNAKADGALSKGDVVYISGVSGDVPTVGQAKADDASKMPAFGLALSDANDNAALQVVTFGTIEELDTSGVSEGQILYVSTTAGEYTTTAPTGESSQIQNIGKVIRSHASAGSIKVGGAGRSNATPNLDNGKIFIGNASNESSTATLDTSIVVENTNLYYTTTRANTDFDTRLATKDTGDLTEGSNLYYTTARVNSDFDTRLATKDTGDLAEGSNLYYTDARVNSAFDTRLATKDTDDLSEGTTNLYYTSSRANTDFDTRLATKSTTDLAEGTNLYYTSARFDSAFTSKDTDDLSEGTTNLYYTSARFDSAFGNKTTSDLTEGTNLYYTDTRANSAIDTRVTKAFVDALGIQASSVDANSVTLGTDTVGNYVQTITGTANKITVTGSGSESADVTLTLPDDVQIADSLTVAGNLTVNGTLTSLDTTNLDIEDNLFQLNAGLTGSPVNDSGMLINRGTADNGIFMWDESVDKFTLGLTTADGSATGNITLNSLGTLVANIEGDVTGAVTGTVSSLSNHDTDDLAEGSNLYYTQARFDSAFTAKSTSDLSEGSNLYYTDARFDTRLATKDTDDLSEGTSNLYYTTARFDSAFSGKSTSDLSEGSNLYYTDARVQAVSINNVVEDTTPQLGGNLDLNSSDITGTGDINITGTITSSGNITGTLATAAQPNITSVGTLSTLTVDDITINGSTISDSGDLTLDVGGDIILDADGGDIKIKDGGTDVGIISVVNSDRMVFATADGLGLQFDKDNNRIIPCDAAGAYNNNVELGDSSLEFTNLWLSNNAYIGNAVGIGTDNPAQPLHVDLNGTSTSKKYLQLDGNGSSGSVSGQTGIGFRPIGAGSNVHASIEGLEDGNGTYKTALSFNINNSNSDTTPVEAMRIDSSGNVAIGSTSDALANMSGLFRALNSSGGDRTVAHFGAHNYGDTGKTFINIGTEYGDGTSRIGSFNDTGNSSVLVFDTHSATSGQFTERMRIDSAGRVGLGSQITSNQASTYDSRANDFVVSGGGDTGITIAGGSTEDIRIVFTANGTTGLSKGSFTYDNANDTLAVETGGSQRIRIDSDGLKFGSDSAAANALDDYEEGTWTPILSFGGGTTGITYGQQSGTYTKIGNIVCVNFAIVLTSKGTSSGVAAVGALPFSVGVTNTAFLIYSDRVSTTGGVVAGYIGSGNSIALFNQVSGGNSSLTNTAFVLNSYISGALTYRVA